MPFHGIKSYRGLLPSGGQDKIRLTTTDGRTGYRIVKFQIMPDDPFTNTVKHVMKIYKSLQSTIDDSVNFTDSDLLGVATYMESADLDQAGYGVIIFDQEIFNQDIYITNIELTNTEPGNYYIELEQIKLSTAQAELLIVKSLRGEVWTRP